MAEKRDNSLSPIESNVPYILQMENMVSEKLITMCLLEGLIHGTPGVNTKACFTEIEGVNSNGMFYIEGINCKLPVNGDIFSPVSSYNTSAWTFGGKIGIFFDIIFYHHLDNNSKRNDVYACVVTLYRDIMTEPMNRSNMYNNEIITLRQMIDV